MTNKCKDSIWFQDYSLEQLNTTRSENMTHHLEINYKNLTTNSLQATMPVNNKTQQPFGLLHGGASCVLAESLGSVCSWMTIDPSAFSAVGLEINANHIRSARSGLVTGTCTPIHVGRRTQIWSIEIHDDTNKLICISRLTCAILPIQK